MNFPLLPYGGVPVNGVDEVQTLAITGTPTGGSLTLTYDGETTAAIAYNASATEVQNALQALSNVAAGDVACSGGNLPDTAVSIAFRRNLGGLNVSLITADGTNLTGGTVPTASVTTTTAGIRGTYRGAQPSAFLADTTNGKIYQNTGDVYTVEWTEFEP